MVNRVASESLASPRGADLLVRETLVVNPGCPLSPSLYFSRVTRDSMNMSMSPRHSRVVPIKSSVSSRDRSDSRRPHG
jgi:hypothetical protein